MRQFRTHTYFLRPIAAVLLAVFLQACMRWVEVPEPKTLATKHRTTIRLTLLGAHTPVIVKHPTIVGDSLFWTQPEPAGVPLARVTYLEARAAEPVATGFFILVGVTFVTLAAIHKTILQ